MQREIAEPPITTGAGASDDAATRNYLETGLRRASAAIFSPPSDRGKIFLAQLERVKQDMLLSHAKAHGLQRDTRSLQTCSRKSRKAQPKLHDKVEADATH